MDGIIPLATGWSPTRGLALALAAEFVDRAPFATSLGALADLIGVTVRELGFAYFALVQHASLASPPPGLVALHDYPRAWTQRFIATDLYRRDPVHQAAARSVTGFAWSRLDEFGPIAPQQRQMLDDARLEGLGEGFTVPLRAPAARLASFSVAMAGSDPLPTGSLMAAEYLAHMAYGQALRLVRTLDPARRVALSRRQTECVALVAQGKTDWEIGRILGLSEETITKYLAAARQRFGVATRTQLAIAALDQGLLGIGEVRYRQ